MRSVGVYAERGAVQFDILDIDFGDHSREDNSYAIEVQVVRAFGVFSWRLLRCSPD